MTLSAGPTVILMKGRVDMPCGSCLFDLAEASGMAGARPCPLKSALLRRCAEPAGVPACDAFTPGFCEGDETHAADASDLKAQLS